MTVMAEDVRVGLIYAIRRPDLGLCYVGQTINFDARMARHRNDTNKYIHTALFADGVEPEILVITDAAQDALDEAERDAMCAQAEDGWILINVMGPNDMWPHVPAEVAALGHLARKTHGFTVMWERAKSDPALAAKLAATRTKNMRKLRERRAADPEFDARCHEAERAGGARGTETRRRKRAEDPEWAAREKEAARRGGQVGGRVGGRMSVAKMQKMRRKCLECDLPATTPGALGQHLRWSGHTQWIALPSLDQTGA